MMMMMMSAAFTQQLLPDENKYLHAGYVNQFQCIQVFILELRFFYLVILMLKPNAYMEYVCLHV